MSAGHPQITLSVREKGYAISDEELEVGLRSLAVPVARSTGEIIAAVSVSACTGSGNLECRINPRACITPLRDRALERPIIARGGPLRRHRAEG